MVKFIDVLSELNLLRSESTHTLSIIYTTTNKQHTYFIKSSWSVECNFTYIAKKNKYFSVLKLCWSHQRYLWARWFTVFWPDIFVIRKK